MDPKQQTPSSPRPNQRTNYISDFTPGRQATSPVTRAGTPSPDTSGPKPETRSERPASFTSDDPPPVAPHATKPIKPHQGLRDVLSIFGVLGSALVLAFCLITFVFQSYQVDGPSMQSTLENSDHLIVWKVPRTIANITHHQYVPKRGDIIVFNESGINGGGNKQLIKRVIGLPGERVVFSGTDVTVYNKDNPDGFNPDKTLGYGKGLINQNPSNNDVTLGPSELFVSGDHRDNSLDSRIFGPIQTSQIVGKLVLRVLPLNTATKF
jgi:signal peptidase I